MIAALIEFWLKIRSKWLGWETLNFRNGLLEKS